MKKKQRILAGLLGLLLLVMLLPLGALAAEGDTELNDGELSKRVTVKQSEPGLALTDSVAMLLRRSAIREGAERSAWRGFTENYVLTQNGGAAVSGSRTYSLNGYSYTVKAYKADGLGESNWTAILNDHPEGVVLRFRSAGGETEQGLLLARSSGGVFYCLDPDPATEAGLIDVCESGYGKNEAGKSKSKLFSAVTYYYAVSSTINAHVHTYGTEGDALGVCQTCGYAYYLEHQSELSGRATPAEGLTGFSLKLRPYAASDSVRENGTLLRFTTVNVLGISKNHFGNVWYLVESPDKKYSGYVWEDNLTVSSSSAVVITGVNVPENNAVEGTGARTEIAGTVTATGARLSAVTAAVYAYDSLSSAELYSILSNTYSASSAEKLAAKRAEKYATATDIESAEFELSAFSSRIRFDQLSGGRKYIYAVTATDADKNSTTVYKAFYLSSGIAAVTDHTVRLSVSGSVSERVVADGGSITLPEPSRTGYTLLGWAEGESGEADHAPGSKYTPKADVTLYAMFRKIAAPAVPKLAVEKEDAAVGETVALKASASGAERYVVNVYVSGSLLRSENFSSGTISLAFEKEGTYSVKAEAFAGESGSGESAAVTINVHAPLLVTFMNGEDVWAEEQVSYGGTAAEPVMPTQPGSTFTGWDGSLENIRKDTVLHAGFLSGAYTVTFLDEKGNTVSVQQVAYNGSASAPEAPEKEGYAFLSWNTDAWKHVTEDGLTVSPVYIRQGNGRAVDMTFNGTENLGNGKLISYKVSNRTGNIQTGRARFKGRSSVGELEEQAMGDLFVLMPGESFTEKVFVQGKKAVLWEYSVTDASDKALLCDPGMLLMSGDGESTLWLTDSELKKLGVSYQKIEEVTQYSTSATETYTTTASSFLDWDKKSGSEAAVWSAWSDWQKESVTASKKVEVEKRQVTTVPAHTEYRYGRWYAENVTRTATDEKHALGVSPSLAYAKTVFKNASSNFSKQFTAWSTARYAAAESFRTKYKDNEKTYYSAASGFYFWHVYYAGAPAENNAYFWEESRNVPAVTETQYRYRVRTEGEMTNVFTHKKAPVWSFTSAKNASTRKVIHVSAKGAVGGSPVTFTGSLGDAAANRDALLSVRMKDASGRTNSYTEQILLDANGDYSITIADLSALSVIKAPCSVYLSVAGSTESICLGTFVSAGDKVTVRFADSLTGALLSEQTVASGTAVQAPAAEAHEGYLFSGWSKSPAHITEDTVITAEYQKETFTVIFADSIAGTQTAVSGIPYGHAAEAPKVKEPTGYTFMGWAVPEGYSLSNVTEPMRVEAVYAEKLHTVTYLSMPKGYDSRGNAQTDTLAAVTVRDGDYVTAPEISGDMHIPDSMYFIGWSEGAADPVTKDLILVPVVGCVLDADEVVPSLPGGMYAEGEKLTLHAADTKQLIVRYRFNTSKAQGEWTEYDIRKSPAITLSSSGVLEIESMSPDKNTRHVSCSYTVASSSSLPAVPTIKSAKQTDSGTVTVTWAAVKNAKGYILKRVSDCGEVCTHMLTGTSFEDEGLRPQRNYTYSVSAFTQSEKSGSTFLLVGKSSKTLSVRFYGTDKPVTKITVKGPKTVYTDSSVQLEAVITPTDAAEPGVYWTVDSGSSHGSISSEGVFTALSVGTVSVSARAIDGSSVSGALKITVKEPETNAATLSVSTASASAGSTAQVTVSLSKNSMAKSMRFTVRYNSSKLTLNSVKKGALISGESPTIGTKTKGVITFKYDGSTLTESGTLLTLNFTMKSSATGSAYVQVATEDEGYELELIDANNRAVDVAIKNGSVSVRGMQYGDIDGSGTVDVEDAFMVRSYINGDLRLTAEQKAIADVNGDGKINSTDITLIRKYIVKLISKFPAED